MVSPRTEEQKILQSPVVVVLGGEEHQIKPLVIKDSREWRRKLASALGKLPEILQTTTDTPDSFSHALNAMLFEMPETVADLFFSYAKELNRDEIEGIATDAELASAFEEVVKIAFPLSGVLPKVLGKTSLP